MDDPGKWSFSSDSLLDLRPSLSSPTAMESPMLNDLDGKKHLGYFLRKPHIALTQ